MHALAALLGTPSVSAAGTPAGWTEALEARLPELSTLAFRVAYGVLRQRQDAEDVAQDALVRAHRKLGSLRDPALLPAWVVRIAWRLALDHRRSAQRRGVRELLWSAQDHGKSAEQLASDNEFRERLWRAIDGLPEKLRMVVVLAGIEGHTVNELAGLLQLPEGTVKSRLFLARKQLAEVLR